jgi:hypothetical protein
VRFSKLWGGPPHQENRGRSDGLDVLLGRPVRLFLWSRGRRPLLSPILRASLPLLILCRHRSARCLYCGRAPTHPKHRRILSPSLSDPPSTLVDASATAPRRATAIGSGFVGPRRGDYHRRTQCAKRSCPPLGPYSLVAATQILRGLNPTQESFPSPHSLSLSMQRLTQQLPPPRSGLHRYHQRRPGECCLASPPHRRRLLPTRYACSLLSLFFLFAPQILSYLNLDLAIIPNCFEFLQKSSGAHILASILCASTVLLIMIRAAGCCRLYS